MVNTVINENANNKVIQMNNVMCYVMILRYMTMTQLHFTCAHRRQIKSMIKIKLVKDRAITARNRVYMRR